jgi:hypothetical protein
MLVRTTTFVDKKDGVFRVGVLIMVRNEKNGVPEREKEFCERRSGKKEDANGKEKRVSRRSSAAQGIIE